MEDSRARQPGQVRSVSNELVDLSYACAAHAEHHLTAPRASGKVQFHCIDDEIFVAGQIDDSTGTLDEIQVSLSPSTAQPCSVRESQRSC